MRFQTRHALRSAIAACVLAKPERPMRSRTAENPIKQLVGTIEQVDPISRELNLRVGDELWHLYVPFDCPIVLNDERVKLRLLQSTDAAYVMYTQEHDTPIAVSIAVRWGTPSIEADRLESARRAPVGLMECT